MKNLCSYCGRQSGTHAPFPQKEVNSGTWLSVICPRCYSMEQMELLDYKRTEDSEFKETLIAQNKNDHKRKMVGNGKVDLVFWFNEDESIYGFQYSLRSNDFDEVLYTWSIDHGGRFQRLVTKRRVFATNTLEPETDFPKEKFVNLFLESSINLKKEYRDFVLEKLEQAEVS